MSSIKKQQLLRAVPALALGTVLALARTQERLSSLLLPAAAVCALALVLMVLLQESRSRGEAQALPPDRLCFGLLTLSGFLFLIAAILFGLTTAGPVVRAVTALFSLLCGVCTLLRLPARDQGQRSAVCSLPPVFLMACYLLILYRGNGDNPYLETFGPEIAVVLLALLGVYFCTAPRFETHRPRLYGCALTLALAAIGQELIFAVLRWTQVMRIRSFSPGALALLAACGGLILCGLRSTPERLPAPSAEEASGEEASAEDRSTQ